jgi:translation initiation factor 1A
MSSLPLNFWRRWLDLSIFKSRAAYILAVGKRKIIAEPKELENMPEPGPDDVYGVISKMVGYDKVIVDCSDGKQRLCRIRGQLKRKIWVKEGDLVLVSPWDFQRDTRGDIWWRFTKNQALSLAQKGVLPEFLRARIEK